MVFLHSHGVSTSRAVRIYKTYGESAIEKVRANPYSLAKDIHGIGFKTADQIAQKVGIPRESLLRAEAGLAHVLLEAVESGHCALARGIARPRTRLQLLKSGSARGAKRCERLLAQRELIRETVGEEDLVFLPACKSGRGNRGAVSEVGSGAASYPPVDLAKAIAWCEKKTGKQLAPSQQHCARPGVAPSRRDHSPAARALAKPPSSSRC